MIGGIGAQITLPTEVIKPYVNGLIGFSDFFTNSQISSTNSQNTPFASSNNFDDNGFTTMYGGGILIRFKTGKNPIALDLGAQFHNNPDIQYPRCSVVAARPAFAFFAGMFLLLGKPTLDRAARRLRLFAFFRNDERAAYRRAEPLLGDLAILALAPRFARDDANVAGGVES